MDQRWAEEFKFKRVAVMGPLRPVEVTVGMEVWVGDGGGGGAWGAVGEVFQ